MVEDYGEAKQVKSSQVAVSFEVTFEGVKGACCGETLTAVGIAVLHNACE